MVFDNRGVNITIAATKAGAYIETFEFEDADGNATSQTANSFKFVIREGQTKNSKLVKQLTVGSGIAISGNLVTVTISKEDLQLITTAQYYYQFISYPTATPESIESICYGTFTLYDGLL